MHDKASTNSGPFDVDTIARLVALMSEHDVGEIDLRHGDRRIRLRRGELLKSAAGPAAAPPPTAEAPPPARPLIPIKSPTPGTFYSRPNPDSPPYVTVGSRVGPTTAVCQIEAMKIFNEIQAECAGVVVEVCVEDKSAVEFGTVLFRVDPVG